uniref:condensation domain-containing protein n=1 Tax=Phenylobacterium sp. TaxID=1871053 RepID=UPI0037CB619E
MDRDGEAKARASSAAELLVDLRQAGIDLRTEEGDLRYSARKGQLTPALLDALRTHKREILALIAAQGAARLGPASPAQEGLWLLAQLTPGNAFYNYALSAHITGPLDVARLERALGRLVSRHEALRTRIETVEGIPVQVVDPPRPVQLRVQALSRADLAGRLQILGAYPFDLACEPLFKVELFNVGSKAHVLGVVMHHIVSDAWSQSLFIREVAALYAALADGYASALPELSAQYLDYAGWERARLARTGPAQLAYWRGQLAGAPAALELPTDRPRPASPSFQGAATPVGLSQTLSVKLTRLAHGQGATLFMVLLAGFQAVLSRWSGQEDIVVGSPVSRRQRPEFEPLIGLFINTLALRTDLSGDPSFTELVGRVRETALGAYAHQDLPF